MKTKTKQPSRNEHNNNAHDSGEIVEGRPFHPSAFAGPARGPKSRTVKTKEVKQSKK